MTEREAIRRLELWGWVRGRHGGTPATAVPPTAQRDVDLVAGELGGPRADAGSHEVRRKLSEY